MSKNINNNKEFIAAGIDIGSNSIRMLIAKVANGKIIEAIDSKRVTTRLAAGIKTSGKLCSESFNKSVDVLIDFKNILDKLGVSHVKAVATSAVREAENGQDFIDAVKKIGININIISGIEEANLVLEGVRTGMDTGDFPLIMDTGGGSTELIAAGHSEVVFAESYKIGVVKLVDQFNMKDGAMENIEPCKAFIADFFKDVKLPLNCGKIIATAGTATTVAAIDMKMAKYDWRKVNGHNVSKNTIENFLNKIAITPFDERINIIGMEKGREDLVIPGMIIILEIMSKSGFDSITVSDFGLREGVVIAASMD